MRWKPCLCARKQKHMRHHSQVQETKPFGTTEVKPGPRACFKTAADLIHLAVWKWRGKKKNQKVCGRWPVMSEPKPVLKENERTQKLANTWSSSYHHIQMKQVRVLGAGQQKNDRRLRGTRCLHLLHVLRPFLNHWGPNWHTGYKLNATILLHTVSSLEERAGYIHNARRAGNESVSQRFQSPPTAAPPLFKIAVLLRSDSSAESWMSRCGRKSLKASLVANIACCAEWLHVFIHSH